MSDIVQKLWGFCHTLRHDGIDYGDYIEQITYLLFLKMADEKGIGLPKGCSWPDVRAELRHEASLGFIDDSDVGPTAHPFLRLGRAGWNDAGAHRQFVRIANRIALRKRQQRNRPDEMARLYQLEIIKLRMELREMSRLDHDTMRRRRPTHDDELQGDSAPRRSRRDR